MGKLHKTKSKSAQPAKEVMILHNQLQQQELVKKNRILLLIVSALMMVVFVLSSYLLPAHTMVEELKEKQLTDVSASAENLKNPLLTAEIDTLKGQLVGVVSGSIESKLNSLEKSIPLASGMSALETIHSLKEDVKVLRTYSNPLEKKKQQDFAVNKVLAKEVSQLKNLIYLTLGSCGLMFAALAGIWLKGRKQLISRAPEYLEKQN